MKGCDSRSVVELLQEKLIERDKVKVFGMPCSGVVELAKIRQALEAKGAAMGRGPVRGRERERRGRNRRRDFPLFFHE